MKNRCLLFVVTLYLLFTVGGSTSAQNERPNRRDLIEAGGEPELFQSSLRYLMLAVSGTVYLDPTCTFNPGDLGPDDHCVLLNPGTANTPFDVRDIGRITLPGNSTRNALVFITNDDSNFQLQNTTGVPQPTATFSFAPYLTVESDALNDPRAVDGAGNPLNGKLDHLFVGPLPSINKSLAIDERLRESIGPHARIQSFFIKSLLTTSFADGGFGLPADIVDRMFRGPITIRLNIRGGARLTSDAFMFFVVRVFGN